MAFDGILRQSTAVDVLIGPFVDATDGVTPETGLTIQVDVSKNGQALADRSDVTNPTHDAAGTVDGYYNCELDATDTNTVGNLVLACFASGALQVRHSYQVVEEAIYDAYYAASATGLMPANVTQWLGSAAATPTVAGVPEVDLTHVAGSTTSVSTLASSVATLLADWLNGGRLDLILDIIAADTTTDIPALIATLQAFVDTEVAAILADTNELQTDWANGGRLDLILDIIAADTTTDIPALIGTPAGASVSADIAAIEAQTDDIGAAGAGLTAADNAILAILGTPAGASMSADIAAMKVDTAAILVDTGTTLDGKIDTIDNFLDTEMAAVLAAVDTEVAAILALLDDARGEPGQGAPPVNPDLATKIDYLYKAWRNKKDNDGTTTNLYADDAATVDHKQTTSEAAGTVTKGEWATGA